MEQVEETAAFHPDVKDAFLSEKTPQAVTTDKYFGIPPFYIPLGKLNSLR